MQPTDGRRIGRPSVVCEDQRAQPFAQAEGSLSLDRGQSHVIGEQTPFPQPSRQGARVDQQLTAAFCRHVVVRV
jgi:hypothetical protein